MRAVSRWTYRKLTNTKGLSPLRGSEQIQSGSQSINFEAGSKILRELERKQNRTGNTKSLNRSFVALAAVLFAVAISVAGVSNYLLYQTAFEEERLRLFELVSSKAALIDAVATYDVVDHITNHEFSQSEAREHARVATLSQLEEAHSNYDVAGRTGEFTYGMLEDTLITFLFGLRDSSNFGDGLAQIPQNSERAEPMRRALAGESGVDIAVDYRGRQVLAAYVPVRSINIGLVAKIDVEEVRAPFIRAGALTGALAICLAILGTSIFLKVGRPLRLQVEGEEARYAQLLESAQEGIWVIDSEGKTSLVNSSLCTMLGYEPEELTGRYPFEFVPEGVPEHFFEHLEKCRNGLKQELDLPFLNKSGKTVHAMMVTSPIFDSKGRFEGAIAGVVDVTRRKQMERELFKADKLASLSLLAGGLAHDFRNVLTVIGGNLSLAQEMAEADSELMECLDDAYTATAKADLLVQRLLTFAKGGDPSCQRIRIADIVRENVELGLSHSNVSYEIAKAEAEVWVNADPVQISQVIHNIAVNARQAMHESGRVNIKIAIAEPDEIPQILNGEQIHVRISITDNGPGIPADNLQKIFDPFFTTKDSGTGLGLANSYSIVRRHGGTIVAESVVGFGATFHLYLPAEPPAEDELRHESEPQQESILRSNAMG